MKVYGNMNVKVVVGTILILVCVYPIAVFSQELVIAVENDAAPWSRADGTGFANDVVLAAFNAVGIDAKLLVVPYPRCKSMVMNGEVPACLSMSWAPELNQKVIFSDKPIFVCYADYLISKWSKLQVKKEADLPKGTVVGVVNGYEYLPLTYLLRDKGILKLETTNSEELNLRKLVNQRVDAVIINSNEIKTIESILKNAGVEKEVSFAFRSGILESYIGFSAQNTSGKFAKDQFNRGYRIIESNQTLRAIEAKWKHRTRSINDVEFNR